jgi:hypothetical protein
MTPAGSRAMNLKMPEHFTANHSESHSDRNHPKRLPILYRIVIEFRYEVCNAMMEG